MSHSTRILLGCVSKLCKCNRASIKKPQEIKTSQRGWGCSSRQKTGKRHRALFCAQWYKAFPAKVRSGFALGNAMGKKFHFQQKCEAVLLVGNVAAEQIGVVRRFQ